MSPREIAEKIVNNEALFASIGAKVNSDALDLARAYLELEKKIMIQKPSPSSVHQAQYYIDIICGLKDEITKLKKSREGLRKFVDHCCSWNEGEVVTGSFDSPWTAREAREALKADDELMKEGE